MERSVWMLLFVPDEPSVPTGTWPFKIFFKENGQYVLQTEKRVEVIPRMKEFAISFSSFIPENNLEAPPQYRCGELPGEVVILKGDDRGFDVDSDRYRLRQTATVVTGGRDQDGIRDGTRPESLVGESKSYARNALDNGKIDVSDDDVKLNDCHLLHERATATNQDMYITVNKINSEKTSIRMHGFAGLPLSYIGPSPAGAPAIDWDFTIIIDTSGRYPSWAITGAHDSFPAYEVFINRIPIYTFDPGPGPYTFDQIRGLYPPTDINIEQAGLL